MGVSGICLNPEAKRAEVKDAILLGTGSSTVISALLEFIGFLEESNKLSLKVLSVSFYVLRLQETKLCDLECVKRTQSRELLFKKNCTKIMAYCFY